MYNYLFTMLLKINYKVILGERDFLGVGTHLVNISNNLNCFLSCEKIVPGVQAYRTVL